MCLIPPLGGHLRVFSPAASLIVRTAQVTQLWQFSKLSGLNEYQPSRRGTDAQTRQFAVSYLNSVSESRRLDLTSPCHYHLFRSDAIDSIQGWNSDERLEQFADRTGQWSRLRTDYQSSVYFCFACSTGDRASSGLCSACTDPSD